MDKKYILARNLRKSSTKEEQMLWNLLRNRQFFGLKFKRQVPIGVYVADFLCFEKKIIIEIDGGQHNQPENIKYDEMRTQYLISEGYRVIRYWNNDITTNLSGVYEDLVTQIM